jgi:hypothetical protein
MHQPRPDISAVGNIYLGQYLLAVLQFVELPFGGATVQMRRAFASQSGNPHRQEKFQAFDNKSSGLRLAANIKPQNGKSQRGVDRKLRLLRIHSQHGEAGLSAPQQPARINRAERTFQID